MSEKYQDGTAVYDLIRDALRDGRPRTVAEIATATGYSLGYTRQWLGKMPDVIVCGSTQAAPRAYRYRIDPW